GAGVSLTSGAWETFDSSPATGRCSTGGKRTGGMRPPALRSWGWARISDAMPSNRPAAAIRAAWAQRPRRCHFMFSRLHAKQSGAPFRGTLRDLDPEGAGPETDAGRPL